MSPNRFKIFYCHREFLLAQPSIPVFPDQREIQRSVNGSVIHGRFASVDFFINTNKIFKMQKLKYEGTTLLNMLLVVACKAANPGASFIFLVADWLH